MASDRSDLFKIAGLAGLAALAGRGQGSSPGAGEPVAQFNTSTDGLEISVDASPSQDPVGEGLSYSWELNGQTASSRQAVFPVDAQGDYEVSLTVQDVNGKSDTTSKTVTVGGNESPSVFMDTTASGLSVTATATGSDPEGDDLTYTWQFNNSKSASGPTASFSVSSSGQYPIEVAVQDEFGNTAVASKTVTLQRDTTPPSVDSLSTNQLDTFTVEASVSASGDAQSFTWDWGDGSTDETTATSAQHQYSELGDYTVTVTANGTDQSDSSSTSVSLSNPYSYDGDINPCYGYHPWTNSDGTSRVNVCTPGEEIQVYPDGTVEVGVWVQNLPDENGGTCVSPAFDVNLGNQTERVSGSACPGNTPQVWWATFQNPGGTEATVTPVESTVPPFDDGGGEDTPPTANISFSVDGNTVTVDGSDSTDDNGITEYDWNLQVKNAATPNYKGSGETNTFEDVENGEYTLGLTVTDTAGQSDSETRDVIVDNVPGTRMSVFANEDVNNDISGSIAFTDDFTIIGGDEYVDGTSGNGFTFSFSQKGDSVVAKYQGDFATVTWVNGPISLTDDGSRVDPYDYAGDLGPREHNLEYGDPVVEITIYETRELYFLNGYAPARTVAKCLAAAFDRQNVSYDILYDLPVADNMPTNSVSCQGRDDCNTDGCDSWDCCSKEDALGGVLEWWRDEMDGFTIMNDAWEDHFGERFDIGPIDTFVQRKDSNLLLTTSNGGGCAFEGGLYATAGADKITDERDWPGETGKIEDYWGRVHAAMHEVGHNLGYIHDSNDQSKDNGGGFRYYDFLNWVHYSPCGTHNAWSVNECNDDVDERRDSEEGTYSHLYYTDCTVNNAFTAIGGGKRGNSKQARQTKPARTPPDDCLTCTEGQPEGRQGACKHSGQCRCD